MEGLSRRAAIAGAGLVSASALCEFCNGFSNAQAQGSDLGCVPLEAEFAALTWHRQPDYFAITKATKFDSPLLSASDDRSFDRALAEVVLRPICEEYQIDPGFGYYDERERPNGPGALASSYTRVSSTKGTVVVGLARIRTLLRLPQGEYAILATCAHEAGHIKQIQTGIDGLLLRRYGHRTGNRLKELHADFIAGYYLGHVFSRVKVGQEAEAQRAKNTIGQLWYEMGSGTRTDPGSHGTPDQRVAAIEAGFSYRQQTFNANMAGCLELGLVHVASL